MIIDLIFLPILFAVSYIIGNYIQTRDLGFLNTIFSILGFTGAAIHELSHYAMCVIYRMPVEEISVKYCFKGGAAYPHGHVPMRDTLALTFIKALMVSLAPLLIGWWIILLLLDLIFITENEILILIPIFLIISIILGAAPSSADLKVIGNTFMKNIRHNLLQLGLLALSLLSLFLFFNAFIDLNLFPPLYYFATAFLYVGYKYLFLGAVYMLSKAFSSNRVVEFSTSKKARFFRKPIPYFKFRLDRDDGLW